MGKENVVGEIVRSRGVIENVMLEKGMINLSHEPIPELGWPEMNMDFSVSEHVSLELFAVGKQISFELLVTPDKAYIIEKMTVMESLTGDKP